MNPDTCIILGTILIFFGAYGIGWNNGFSDGKKEKMTRIILILPLLLLTACAPVRSRDIPTHTVNGLRYAFVAQYRADPFVIYADQTFSANFWNCAWDDYHPRKIPLKNAVYVNVPDFFRGWPE